MCVGGKERHELSLLGREERWKMESKGVPRTPTPSPLPPRGEGGGGEIRGAGGKGGLTATFFCLHVLLLASALSFSQSLPTFPLSLPPPARTEHSPPPSRLLNPVHRPLTPSPFSLHSTVIVSGSHTRRCDPPSGKRGGEQSGGRWGGRSGEV
eukprot:Hpha_TRINITY_DN4329_c0_g1::TRINITY_DN4329_c0_g1_i1::g.50274::m.50274